MNDFVALPKYRKTRDELPHGQLRELAEERGLKFTTARSRYVRQHRGDKLVVPHSPILPVPLRALRHRALNDLPPPEAWLPTRALY